MKVKAQRKFAQKHCPMATTPIKKIEEQKNTKNNILPESQELLPMKRPHTEDFLTFLCFRGTSMLPQNLNYFNAVSSESNMDTQPLQKESKPKEVDSFNNSGAQIELASNRSPFGGRKRGRKPKIVNVVNTYMDEKRRRALTLQVLRRKYQKEKMTKIHAVLSKLLPEKVTCNSGKAKRSPFNPSRHSISTKTLTQKNEMKIDLKSKSSLKISNRKINSPIQTKIQEGKCLKSYRGESIQYELTAKKSKKRKTKIIEKVHESAIELEGKQGTSSESSSNDGQHLKIFNVFKSNGGKIHLPKSVNNSVKEKIP